MCISKRCPVCLDSGTESLRGSCRDLVPLLHFCLVTHPVSHPQDFCWLPKCKTSPIQGVKWHLKLKKLCFCVHFFLPPFFCPPKSYPPSDLGPAPFLRRALPVTSNLRNSSLFPGILVVCTLCWVLNCACPGTDPAAHHMAG